MDTLSLDPDAVVWNRPPQDRNGRPLLVLLHGFGGHEHDFDPFVSRLPEGHAIASVRAPLPHRSGWAWFPRNPGGGGLTFAQRTNSAVDALLGWLREQPAPAVDCGWPSMPTCRPGVIRS